MTLRVLITGAAGFVGRHLIPKLLERGDEVLPIDIVDSKMFRVDITDWHQMELLHRERDIPDCIIHLAAIAAPKLAEEDPATAFNLNVLGTHNVLKYAIKTRARKLIFASTSHVYGISPKYIPTDEQHPLWLQDNYTTTKILGEQLCQLFYDNHGLAYTTLRMFNGYGPGQSEDYFIPSMIRKAQTGRIELSGRKVTKDFVYVDDMVAAFLAALDTDFVGPINIGSGTQTSLETVASYIAHRLKAELTFGPDFSPGPTQMQCERTRAKRVLGWEPTVSLDRGLDLTIRGSA